MDACSLRVYSSARAAKLAIRGVSNSVHTFYCAACAGWHVGRRQPQRSRRPVRPRRPRQRDWTDEL